ncbi:unnamed protein product, partial [Scytosiphon promiscuus]
LAPSIQNQDFERKYSYSPYGEAQGHVVEPPPWRENGGVNFPAKCSCFLHLTPSRDPQYLSLPHFVHETVAVRKFTAKVADKTSRRQVPPSLRTMGAVLRLIYSFTHERLHTS